MAEQPRHARSTATHVGRHSSSHRPVQNQHPGSSHHPAQDPHSARHGSHVAPKPKRVRGRWPVRFIAIAAILVVATLLFSCLATNHPSRDAASDLVAAAEKTTATTQQVGASAAASSPALSEATSAIIVDGEGNELWGINEDEELPMASITKIMTAMVAIDSGMDLSATDQGIDTSLESGAVVAGYSSADTPTGLELLRVMLVPSANDAAENLATDAAGSREAFIEKMNEKAQEIGMTHTHFMNPTGLEEDGHYSSAADLALMGRYALEHYPLIAQTIRLRSTTATIGGHAKTFTATDSLLQMTPGMLGIKTGSVAFGTSFLGAYQQDGTRVYTCVLGCSTESGRFRDTTSLIDWAFSDAYVRKVYASKSIPVTTVSFSDHFGWVSDVYPISSAIGYVCPGEAGVEQTSVVSTASMGLPGSLWGTSTWTQSGRAVAEADYVVSTPHPEAASLETILFPLEARMR